ncbi:MAG: hypothetical protein NVV70_06230 [Cellulomonas sp.]|nr:hypothetical protein [Cellulomonas sp.]MCR6647743.1 hypothetical protein [Cellulomonas sp.]
MLTELESRLADVLGAALPAPFGGRVRRRGAAGPAGAGPVVRLGVEGFVPLEPDVFSTRPEIAAGASTLRRVVRLRVTIGLDVTTDPPGDRLGELAGTDALLYALQDPAVRSASALVAPGDQGFRLDGIDLLEVGAQDDDPDVLVGAEGWFWPVGVAGQDGREITHALVREVRLPMRLTFDAPLVAGARGGRVRPHVRRDGHARRRVGTGRRADDGGPLRRGRTAAARRRRRSGRGRARHRRLPTGHHGRRDRRRRRRRVHLHPARSARA